MAKASSHSLLQRVGKARLIHAAEHAFPRCCAGAGKARLVNAAEHACSPFPRCCAGAGKTQLINSLLSPDGVGPAPAATASGSSAAPDASSSGRNALVDPFEGVTKRVQVRRLSFLHSGVGLRAHVCPRGT